MFELDHLAVLGTTLAEAVQVCEEALGCPMGPGGQHLHFATHNQLLGLEDDLYLEAIAIDPGQPTPAYPRWFGLDRFRGKARLDKWILRTSDIAAAAKLFPNAGHPVALSRGNLRWTMLVPDNGLLPFSGQFPAIIQWHSPEPPGKALRSSHRALRTLRISGPEATALGAVLDGHFQDPRVAFEEAREPNMTAIFETPTGQAFLE